MRFGKHRTGIHNSKIFLQLRGIHISRHPPRCHTFELVDIQQHTKGMKLLTILNKSIIPNKGFVRRRSDMMMLNFVLELTILVFFFCNLIHIYPISFVNSYATFTTTYKVAFVETSSNLKRHLQSVPVIVTPTSCSHVMNRRKLHLPYTSKRHTVTMQSSSSSVDETETRNHNNNTDKNDDEPFFISNHHNNKNKTNDTSTTNDQPHVEGTDEKDTVLTTPSIATTTTATSMSLPPQQQPKLKQPPKQQQPQQQKELVENLSKAAWQMGTDFFVALRWGAANALTASLPDNQRQILLDRMDTPVSPTSSEEDDDEQAEEGDVSVSKGMDNAKLNSETEDGYERVTNSVNEAVVASIATKTQRDEQKWNKEKEILLQQAEIAAQKRVETELAIQQQRYEEEIQRLAALEQVNNDIDDDDDGNDNDTDDETITPVRHPVLGPVLYDFGYKRLHLVSADILATIPVWKKQRTYRHERAKSMSIDKMKTLHLGFPGVICIHEERSTGKIAIIDGQHRVGMMKILQDKQKLFVSDTDNESTAMTTGLSLIDLDHVLVEVYTESEPYSNGKISLSPSTTNTMSSIADHAQELFTEINKAEPVKLVDMPGVATAKERKTISQACSKLEEQYTIMFRPSQKCRPPNVNIDNLRDTIFASNILKRHTIQSSTQLYDWLLQQNQLMGEKYSTDTKLQSSLNDKVWNKAQANQFYLGLDSSWLYK
jgi:hypothetical protein